MEPPSFSTNGPQIVRAAPGSDASLVLPLPSGSPPFHYEWSRAGANLGDRFKPSNDAGGVRLTISAARSGDSGVYTLQASNAAGKDTTRVQLEVSPDEKSTGEDPPTFLRRLQDLTVKVGTRTRFLVEIVSSTECRVTWYRNERRLLEAERIALVRDGNFWCADISAVSVDDAGRWTCTAENVGGRASCSAHLNVLVPKAYKRPEFVDELRALLTEQGTVSLECKVVGVPTPILRWFKDSREIKAGDVFALTANAEDPTSLGTYTCEAVNCMGRAYSSSKVHVIGRASREGSARPSSGGVALEPPPIFTKELEDQFVRICEPLTLSCNIVVPPWPRGIVWYNKEGKIEPSDRYRVLEDGVGGYLLEVLSAEWPDEGEWKCVATSSGGRVGITTCYVSMDVPKNYRKPRFMENLQAVLTEEGLVSFECKVVGFPTPVLSWFKDGQELKPGDVYQLTGTNSLGSYCCIARNCMGHASSSAELTVEDIQNQLNEEEKLQLFSKNQAPKFLQGLMSVEAKIDEPFRFTIKVAIPPEPTVLWYRDEQPVDESSRCHHGKEERGVFFLAIQNLEFMDQAEWKCVAMNDFGHSVTSCFLKLIIPRHYKKPRFLENLQAILSDEGAVNLECKVIGVPQPVLKWYKDGEELKPGDIHRIISGQDGTCCLGTYTCEAQNCMGIAASSASLLGFEDSMKAKSKTKADEQTLQRNLSLSTIHEERTSQMYDTPVGDITLDDKGEISFSFDGKEVSVSLYETPDLTEEEALQIVEMYADQLSENVTEHNVVELPPLRFVKETSTSGNLLMEAIIIDVSPEYFTSPDEDLRTEADVEDISIADENGIPQLSLDQEIDGEDYLEKTIALLSDEKADFPKKSERKKSDSQKSAEDYFSLSRDQSLSEEKKDDESDLQSFASARSSGKPKSKSSKPSVEDGQESSDITKTVLLKDDLQSRHHEMDSQFMKNKPERRNSRGSRKSSSGSEKSLSKMRTELLENKLEDTLNKTILNPELTKSEINSITFSLSKVINDIQMIERDIILKSELMSTAATASRSLEIINSLITPLSEVHSIADTINETVSESLDVTTSLFSRLPQTLNVLHKSLTIIEKCIDIESDNKTLVKKTCINIIEKCGEELNKLMREICSLVNRDYPVLENMPAFSIQTTTNEILNSIACSVDAIKESKKITDIIDLKLDNITPELKHLQKTQKAVYELRSPLQSLLNIVEEVDIPSCKSIERITNSQIILNNMSIPIQELQNALVQIEYLSMTETQSNLQKYNTEIIETVMEPVIKLRTSFEQLSAETGKMEKIDIINKILVEIKHNIIEISDHVDIFRTKLGPLDILESENKLEVLQKMAQTLINLENNLAMQDMVPCLKTQMTDFHKNLTKVLEYVIESNEAGKYFSFLEICDAVNRLNTLLKNMVSNDTLSLAGINNSLKIIQANIEKNEFTPELKYSILLNLADMLGSIDETILHADVSILSANSENVEDLSVRSTVEGKLNILLEQIEKTIITMTNVTSLETTNDLILKQSLDTIIPTLAELKCCVASLNINVTEQEENVSELSNFSFTQSVAHPLRELNLGLSVLNQVICEKVANCQENDPLKMELATPLLEIRNALEILQQDVISQSDENLNYLNISNTIANAVQSIQSCILVIQEQDLPEIVEEISTLEDISAIKTSADILLTCDYFISPVVQERGTEINTQVMQSASVETLKILTNNMLLLQNPEVMETLDTLSEHYEYSNIKSVIAGLDKILYVIEDILHPITFEDTQNLPTFVSSTKLATIIKPLQDLYNSLSIIDMSKFLVENTLETDKINILLQNILKLENCVRDSLNIICSAIETADGTLEISNNVDSLQKLCENLKINLELSKNDTNYECSELIILDDAIKNVLDTISNPHEINIAQIKRNTEKLQQTIIMAQDEILGLAVQTPTVLANEIKILKAIDDIEKKIATLAQLQFVDICEISEFDNCESPQLSNEIKLEVLNKIENVIEESTYFIQVLSQDVANNSLVITEDFYKTFKNEMILLACLLKQRPGPKQTIKMLQIFYDLRQKFKQLQTHQQNSCITEDLDKWLINTKECLKHFQTLLVEILDSQCHLILDIPISNIKSGEVILHDILESDQYANIHQFAKILLDIVKLVKPWFENIRFDLFEEFELCNFNIDTDSDTIKYFNLLISYVSDKVSNRDTKDKETFESILKVIRNHGECKDAKGTGKKIIFIKCISDCLNVLKQTFKRNEKEVLDVEAISNEYNLEEILKELSHFIENFHNKLMSIYNQNVSKDYILQEMQLTESQLETIKEMTKKLDKCIQIENSSLNKDTLSLAKSLEEKIHYIQKSLKYLESLPEYYNIIISIQPFEEIERLLTILLPQQIIYEEKSQLKEKTDLLLQHMDHYIETIEIVEEVSAVIKLDDLKKSTEALREFRENLTTVQKSSDINLGGSKDNNYAAEIQLVQNLQSALTSLQIQVYDCEQDLAPLMREDIRHLIIEVASDLQNDLFPLTNTYVVLENSETLTKDNLTDNYPEEQIQNNIISNQNKESIVDLANDTKDEQVTQYAITVSEQHQKDEEVVHDVSVGVMSQLNFPIFPQVDEAQTTVEASNIGIFDINKDLLENNKKIQELLQPNLDTEILNLENSDDLVLQSITIKDALIKHINDYLHEDIIEIIKKLSPPEISEQLEQAIRTAVEVRDSASLEDISPLTELEFFKKQSKLVLKLKETLLAIYHEKFYADNLETIETQFGKESLQSVKYIVHNLLNALKMYIVSLDTSTEFIVDNTVEKTCKEGLKNSKDIENGTNILKSVSLCEASVPSTSEIQQTETEEHVNYNILEKIAEEQENGNERLILSEETKDCNFMENQEAVVEFRETEPTGLILSGEDVVVEKYLDSNANEDEALQRDKENKEENEIIGSNRLNEVNIIVDENLIDLTETDTLLPVLCIEADNIVDACSLAGKDSDTLIASEDINVNEEKSNAIYELQSLLQEINKLLDLSVNYPVVQNSEELQDTLEEVQTVIIKLKCDFDGSMNDVLNENIEDLECNVRSVQLQINEQSTPTLLKEACANLQTFVSSMSNIHNAEINSSKIATNNALYNCSNDAEQVIELLNKVSCLTVDSNLDNIISNLNIIKNNMKSLKSSFSDDAESLIIGGIEVFQNLDFVEDKVFTLEKELDAGKNIDTIFRDSIFAAIHSIYGSISNMRGTICSIQKKYMYDNYGKPSENFLKSIKNVNFIINHDNKMDWKQFAKSLRKVLNHFEDIKFYINFDKTARLPSDAAFTKIILDDLRIALSQIVSQYVDKDKEVRDRAEDAINCVQENLNKIENMTTLEVKDKIPVFRQLSIKMIALTDTIKMIMQKNIDFNQQPEIYVRESNLENDIKSFDSEDKIASDNVEYCIKEEASIESQKENEAKQKENKDHLDGQVKETQKEKLDTVEEPKLDTTQKDKSSQDKHNKSKDIINRDEEKNTVNYEKQHDTEPQNVSLDVKLICENVESNENSKILQRNEEATKNLDDSQRKEELDSEIAQNDEPALICNIDSIKNNTNGVTFLNDETNEKFINQLNDNTSTNQREIDTSEIKETIMVQNEIENPVIEEKFIKDNSFTQESVEICKEKQEISFGVAKTNETNEQDSLMDETIIPICENHDQDVNFILEKPRVELNGEQNTFETNVVEFMIRDETAIDTLIDKGDNSSQQKHQEVNKHEEELSSVQLNLDMKEDNLISKEESSLSTAENSGITLTENFQKETVLTRQNINEIKCMEPLLSSEQTVSNIVFLNDNDIENTTAETIEQEKEDDTCSKKRLGELENKDNNNVHKPEEAENIQINNNIPELQKIIVVSQLPNKNRAQIKEDTENENCDVSIDEIEVISIKDERNEDVSQKASFEELEKTKTKIFQDVPNKEETTLKVELEKVKDDIMRQIEQPDASEKQAEVPIPINIVKSKDLFENMPEDSVCIINQQRDDQNLEQEHEKISENKELSNDHKKEISNSNKISNMQDEKLHSKDEQRDNQEKEIIALKQMEVNIWEHQEQEKHSEKNDTKEDIIKNKEKTKAQDEILEVNCEKHPSKEIESKEIITSKPKEENILNSSPQTKSEQHDSKEEESREIFALTQKENNVCEQKEQEEIFKKSDTKDDIIKNEETSNAQDKTLQVKSERHDSKEIESKEIIDLKSNFTLQTKSEQNGNKEEESKAIIALKEKEENVFVPQEQEEICDTSETKEDVSKEKSKEQDEIMKAKSEQHDSKEIESEEIVASKPKEQIVQISSLETKSEQHDSQEKSKEIDASKQKKESVYEQQVQENISRESETKEEINKMDEISKVQIKSDQQDNKEIRSKEIIASKLEENIHEQIEPENFPQKIEKKEEISQRKEISKVQEEKFQIKSEQDDNKEKKSKEIVISKRKEENVSDHQEEEKIFEKSKTKADVSKNNNKPKVQDGKEIESKEILALKPKEEHIQMSSLEIKSEEHDSKEKSKEIDASEQKEESVYEQQVREKISQKSETKEEISKRDEILNVQIKSEQDSKEVERQKIIASKPKENVHEPENKQEPEKFPQKTEKKDETSKNKEIFNVQDEILQTRSKQYDSKEKDNKEIVTSKQRQENIHERQEYPKVSEKTENKEEINKSEEILSLQNEAVQTKSEQYDIVEEKKVIVDSKQKEKNIYEQDQEKTTEKSEAREEISKDEEISKEQNKPLQIKNKQHDGKEIKSEELIVSTPKEKNDREQQMQDQLSQETEREEDISKSKEYLQPKSAQRHKKEEKGKEIAVLKQSDENVREQQEHEEFSEKSEKEGEINKSKDISNVQDEKILIRDDKYKNKEEGNGEPKQKNENGCEGEELEASFEKSKKKEEIIENKEISHVQPEISQEKREGYSRTEHQNLEVVASKENEEIVNVHDKIISEEQKGTDKIKKIIVPKQKIKDDHKEQENEKGSETSEFRNKILNLQGETPQRINEQHRSNEEETKEIVASKQNIEICEQLEKSFERSEKKEDFLEKGKICEEIGSNEKYSKDNEISSTLIDASEMNREKDGSKEAEIKEILSPKQQETVLQQQKLEEISEKRKNEEEISEIKESSMGQVETLQTLKEKQEENKQEETKAIVSPKQLRDNVLEAQEEIFEKREKEEDIIENKETSNVEVKTLQTTGESHESKEKETKENVASKSGKKYVYGEQEQEEISKINKNVEENRENKEISTTTLEKQSGGSKTKPKKSHKDKREKFKKHEETQNSETHLTKETDEEGMEKIDQSEQNHYGNEKVKIEEKNTEVPQRETNLEEKYSDQTVICQIKESFPKQQSLEDNNNNKRKQDIEKDIQVKKEEIEVANICQDSRKHLTNSKEPPLFLNRTELDYELEFLRPSGYNAKTFDNDDSVTELRISSKNPTIYKAQSLIQESQLRSSVPPYFDQRSNVAEERTDLKQRSKTASEPRNTISERRAGFPRDIKRKPVFSTHLTNRTAVESSRVKLTCSVLSSTNPTIFWFKNGILIDNKQTCRTKYVDGLITLEILNALPSDSGEYSCTVENENGSITSSANLKVYPSFEASPIPPTFTRSIRDTYHLLENELVLECRIRGQPLPTITWLKDDRTITLNERYQAHYLADGVCRLTIISPNENDSGKYTCKAENSMWSDQITHAVYFNSKESHRVSNITTSEKVLINRQTSESRRPHFTNVLSDHKVVSGGTIGLQVEISGAPTRVEWLREGHSITETYKNAQTYIDHGLYTLALSDVTEKESGLYTCRAWNTHGTVDMNASIIVVQQNQFNGKPATIISRPVKDLLISVGEDLNISFRVQGEPKPKVFLLKGIRDVTNSQRVCKMTSDDYVKFTLKRSVVSDAGTYCVFARNAYGCDRAFVTVVIRQRASSDNLISDWTYPMDDLAISMVDRNYKSVPDRIPSEPSTVDGGNNWISLAWPKPDSQVKAPILAYKVESWLLGKEGGARWTELGITPRNSFDAFNLKQGEEYHFRVTPRNRYGWGESVQTSTPIGIGLAGDRPEFIEILPGQLKILVGEKAILCCSFKGKPLPEIVWMKNGHEIEEETERVTIELNDNNTSLRINDITIEDEGRYSCEATNIHGRSSTYSRMAVITDRQIWAADAKLKRERSAGAIGEYPPQFTMRLRDRRVQATYPVRLTCQVIGNPSPIVTWFKNGDEVSLDSRHTTSQDEYFYTLEIAPTTLDDGGVYEALARNGCGAISCRCNLVVDKGIRAYIAPEFCCGFEPLYRVFEGDELRISAVVEAYPSVGVTWYRDGIRLRPNRRAVMTLDRDGQIELAVASVASRDAGVYTCTASNEVGRASTSGKVEIVKGENEIKMPTVPPIVISPDGPYSREPMFIRKPRSSEAHEGDTVIIECEVIGDPKPDVYWLRDFLKPDYYRDASHFKRVGEGPEYRFEIPHAKFDYTGAYSIVAKNVHGEAKAIISLQILAKDPTSSDDTHNIRYGRVEIIPRFDKELTDLLCYDGDAIEFECRVSGNPDPDIRWFHYTEILPECQDFETSYDLGTARLKIKQVTAEDEGTYTCEASNNLGKATSNACLVIYPPGEPNTLSQTLRRPPALLSASSTPRSTPRTTPCRSLSRTPGPDLRRLCSPSREVAPKFYTYPYNRVVEEGDTIVFQCAVTGLPPPWATWDKDGIVITPTARISIREKDEMFRILQIEEVNIEDVGLYRVTLENDYGRAEASARLEVISQTGKFYGSRSYSVSPRKCLPYRRRTPSLNRQD